jgi:hypothetical protein
LPGCAVDDARHLSGRHGHLLIRLASVLEQSMGDVGFR